jgi:hypothetical protein
MSVAQGAETPAMHAPEREVIPGAERMTPAERDTYRRRMEAAATPEEKARVRAEYAGAAEKAAAPRPLAGNPERGASLHRGCFGCHGIERYVAPVTHAAASFFDSVLRASGLSELPPTEPARFKGRIKSFDALRDAVSRRNDFLNPKMTPQEIEDVVAYLNATYYKFPEQSAVVFGPPLPVISGPVITSVGFVPGSQVAGAPASRPAFPAARSPQPRLAVRSAGSRLGSQQQNHDQQQRYGLEPYPPAHPLLASEVAYFAIGSHRGDAGHQ